MKGARQGIRTSKDKLQRLANDGTQNKIEGEAVGDIGPPPEHPIKKLSNVYFKTVEISKTVYSDDTGPFPYVSQQGKNIVMVAAHINSSNIFAETIRNKSEGEQIHAYQKIIDRMRRA